MLCSGLAVLSIPALFIGLPFVLGSAGIALGMLGREGDAGDSPSRRSRSADSLSSSRSGSTRFSETATDERA